MRNKEEKRKDNFMRIPREKQSFYKRIKTTKEIRELIKLVNYWQKKVK